jgi:NAD(P)-dependent dehydrogenase (short-subunit alcohol dehydrogenase family)
VVKLLEAGATVVGTTRFPQKALELYRKYPEWEKWKKQLKIYPKSLDWDVENIAEQGRKLVRWIENDLKLPAVDILVLSAAQTIRARDKRSDEKSATEDEDTNRYEDSRFVKDCQVNSWQMKLHDLVQQEMEEVYRINAIAPCLLLQQIIPLLKKSPVNPYIVFVHAREGLFTVPKNQKHIHTNMAKAGLSMLTKCLKGAKLHTETGKPMYSHGIDPGWISVDEYHETNRPWIVPPLDEIDGAARILYPVMKRMQGSFMKTRRHFDQLLY